MHCSARPKSLFPKMESPREPALLMARGAVRAARSILVRALLFLSRAFPLGALPSALFISYSILGHETRLRIFRSESNCERSSTIDCRHGPDSHYAVSSVSRKGGRSSELN